MIRTKPLYNLKYEILRKVSLSVEDPFKDLILQVHRDCQVCCSYMSGLESFLQGSKIAFLVFDLNVDKWRRLYFVQQRIW